MVSLLLWFTLILISNSQELITNYEELYEYLFSEGGLVNFEFVSSDYNLSEAGMITSIERFINGTQSSVYGTEYFAYFERSVEFLDYNPTSYQVELNNTEIEIFLQFRIFKNPPINNSNIYPIEMTQYVTVQNDTTGRYKPNQRLSEIVQIFNYTTDINNLGSNYIIFTKNEIIKNRERTNITNYNDLYDLIYNKQCLWTHTFLYGPPMDPHITAGSYGVHFGAQTMYQYNGQNNDININKERIHIRDKGATYLWFGPTLEVYDWGITDFYSEPQKGEEGFLFDGYIGSYSYVTRVLQGDTSGLKPGQVVENSVYYLNWGDTLAIYSFC